jgi:uncharacterized phage-associated protein
MAQPLDVRKIIQAIAVLLHSDRCHRMSYLRLLKLLYIADRESWAQTGHGMFGDKVVAMKHGPVLSGVYYLVESNHPESAIWNEFLRKDGYQLELIDDPGTGELSPYEENKLREIAERFKDADEWDVVNVTHTFPEWLRNWHSEKRIGNVCDIALEDILAAVCRSRDIDAITEEAAVTEAEDALLDRFFAR